MNARADVVVTDLGLPFSTPYTEVLDLSRGIEYPEWFVGGHLNVAELTGGATG